jgi:hypothetical protein
VVADIDAIWELLLVRACSFQEHMVNRPVWSISFLYERKHWGPTVSRGECQ